MKPRATRDHAVIFEALTLGNSLPSEPFQDRHGKTVWRVMLAPGLNLFRRDAIVAASS